MNAAVDAPKKEIFGHFPSHNFFPPQLSDVAIVLMRLVAVWVIPKH